MAPIADGLLRTYAILTAQAVIPIILGSFKSLKTPSAIVSLRRAERKRATLRSRRLAEDVSDDEWADTDGRAVADGGDDEDDEAADEALTWGDTLLFPILGSVVLLGFYLIITYAGKEWINRILGVYFSGAGMFAIQSTFSTLIRFSLRLIGRPAKTYHLRISSELKQVAHSTLTIPTLLLLPFSIGLPLAYIPLDKPYWLSNLIALSLATASLQLLKLDSFATAGLLLGVLLVYDIFWVFATPVMVTVAKSLDAPIKLLAPKPTSSGYPAEFAMLGLGDVVVPGLMIALCLRFDLAQYAKKRLAEHKKEVGTSGTFSSVIASGERGKADGKKGKGKGRVEVHDISPRTPFPRVYFWTGVGSYLVGLGVTMGVMHTFKAAQPALLYLSPACFLGPLSMAAVRGDLPALWAYTESSSSTTDKSPSAPTETDTKRSKVRHVLDETIEGGSEIAQKAREAARGTVDPHAMQENKETAPVGTSGDEQEKEQEGEDDSWMEVTHVSGAGAGGAGGQGGKKRKGKKK